MSDLSKDSASGGFDPYRYGGPPAELQYTHPTGKEILRTTWSLLKQDRELIAVPLVGAAASFAAFAVLFAPGLIVGLESHPHNRVVMYVFAVLGGFAASVIGIFFQTALVIGANQRAEGHDPTFGGVLAGAWALKKQILGWALVTTIVGTVVRAVEERLGIVGRVLGFLAGIAWAVATFFVIPVIVAEGVGPIDAVRQSTATIKRVWGTSVRTTLRFGLIQVLLVLAPMVLLFVGIGIAASGGAGLVGGVVLVGIGALAFIGLAVLFGAIGTYARAVIYRWATGRPVPGMDPAMFAGAFRPRRRRRG